MTAKEKAIELVENFEQYADYTECDVFTQRERMRINAKQCALIAVKNEYHSLREMLFNLRSCGVIENGAVYLFRLQILIDEEKEVKKEIELL